MSSIYLPTEISEGDSAETVRKILYLGVISVGESAYSLGAAVAECRKVCDHLRGLADMMDKRIDKLSADYLKHKELLSKCGPMTADDLRQVADELMRRSQPEGR